MWEELYERYYPELKRYAAGMSKNNEKAEDAVQEVFLKALQNTPVFEELGPNQRRAWLYRALKNELCDRYRREKLEEEYLAGQTDVTYIEPRIQEAENRLLLAMLDPLDRALFHLRYEEGYNASELAQMFNLSPGTIRSRLCRCRSLLKTMLL